MASLEEIRELVLSSIAVVSAKMEQLTAHVEALSTTVALVQDQVTALSMSTPVHGTGAESSARPPSRLSIINEDEGESEEAMDEAFADNKEETDNVSNSDLDGLQLLLQQFARSQREERKLRTKEFQEMMGILRPAAGASSSTNQQPLVRSAPNFVKYDGKCDHGAVTQFIHQFVTHFPLAKIRDPQDMVHLAAPHLTGEDWDTFVSDFKQRFLPPQFLTQLEDEFAAWTQSGRPVLTYSNKLLALVQLIGTPEKEKLRAFTRGLDPKTYEEALALAQNKELELNGGKTRQATGSANSQGGNKNQLDKAQADKGKKTKVKQTPDEK